MSPGPWKISNGHYVVDRHGPVVADVQLEDDARLIAAAPELLEALERALNVAESCSPSRKAIAAGRALIARIRGE